jgi:hypothetical protein
MDLSQFMVSESENYGVVKARQRALQFLSGLVTDLRITSEQWKTLVHIADYVWLTEFTDDSGYIPGSMGFERLDPFPVEVRRDILRYFDRSNWIVRKHVEDYIEQRQIRLEDPCAA